MFVHNSSHPGEGLLTQPHSLGEGSYDDIYFQALAPTMSSLEYCSLRMLTQGILCRRNVIYVPSFEHEEVLSLVTLRYTVSPKGTGERTRLPQSFIKGNHYFPDVIMA